QIMRRQLRHADALSGFLHNVPNRLHRHAISPGPSNFVDPAEQLSSINCGCYEPIVQFGSHPIGKLEPFSRGLPCRPDQQWPNALRAAGADPISTVRLHAASSRTRAAMRAMLGHVFLSVVDDQGACQSAWPCSAVSQLPRRIPNFFTPLTRRIPAAKSELSRPQSAASYASWRTAPQASEAIQFTGRRRTDFVVVRFFGEYGFRFMTCGLRAADQ